MQMKSFAQQTNLPPKTIRYYEEIGLLPPPKRLDNGYRDYNETDVARARFVAGARHLDFSLDDVQEILDLRDQRKAACRVVLDLLEKKANEISRHIAELQQMETELRELRRLGETFPTDWTRPHEMSGIWEEIVCHSGNLNLVTCPMTYLERISQNRDR